MKESQNLAISSKMNLSVPTAKILRGSRKNQLPPEDRFQDKMSTGNRHEKAVRIEKTVQCNRYHPDFS